MTDVPVRWWRATLRWRDRVLADSCVREGERLVVGEGTAWAIPGLGVDAHAVIDGGMVMGCAGLRGDRGALDDGGRELAVGERARLVCSAHPDVTIEIEAQHGEHARFRDGLVRGLWREIAYGLAGAGCLIALLAVSQAVSAAEPAGERGMGRIERAMLGRTPVASFGEPVAHARARFAPPVVIHEPAATVEIETIPPAGVTVIDPPLPHTGPVAVDVGDPKARVVAPKPRKGGRHSHTSTGDPKLPGEGTGKAAVAPARPCDDPGFDPKAQVDVVFVLDVSTTMGFVLDELSSEIAAVDAEVRKHDASPHYGLVVFVDDVKVVGGGDPFTDIDELRTQFDRWAKFTSNNRQIRADGSNLDWPENSLDALHAAATSFAWRDADDTARIVVHATDDSFGSPGDRLSGTVEVDRGYDDVLDVLGKQQIRVATFTARIGGQCECEDVTAGFMSGWHGRPSLPDATGGAAFDLDEVASGRLHFRDAVPPLVANAVCEG